MIAKSRSFEEWKAMLSPSAQEDELAKEKEKSQTAWTPNTVILHVCLDK